MMLNTIQREWQYGRRVLGQGLMGLLQENATAFRSGPQSTEWYIPFTTRIHLHWQTAEKEHEPREGEDPVTWKCQVNIWGQVEWTLYLGEPEHPDGYKFQIIGV